MLKFLSGEFILAFRPNGGTAVFLRACFVSVMVYLLAIGLKSRLALGASWSFDPIALRLLIADTIPWFGAIFAGVYVAFYTRFASQWTYLADLYNQIMATSVENPPGKCEDATRILRMWQAGFIEDAEDLHLATKPLFAAIIRALLQIGEVRRNFVEHAPGGAGRLRLLELRIEKVLTKSAKLHAPRRFKRRMLVRIASLNRSSSAG